VADFMKGLDIFVMPSRVLKHHEEHDAHALMEAMSVGIPSIGTASGAITDVLADAGLIVPPERTEELATALNHLAADEQLRAAYGRRGRQRIQAHYSLEAVAATYAETYRQILGAPRS
jgi:glycosyltransferase involved in cell wall biosynthesis